MHVKFISMHLRSQFFLLLLFILSSNTFASFDNCRMRAIDADPPRYINVCNTPEGQMRLENYYRYLDNGLRITSNFEVIDERSFLPESEYPSRAVAIDSARLSETIRRVSELGRVSDTEEMIRARENSNRIDRINERIREINAARERLIQERDAVIEEHEHRNRLRAQLKNPNPMVRVGAVSLRRAQSSKKEFAGEFGQRHLALKNKFKSVRVEDIKSYKLVGSAGMSFLRSEEEFEGGDKSFASDLLSLSESLLDVGLGIAPGSSLVKDSYELIFGTNMVTGEELSEIDRGIALVGVGVGVVSFGSAGGVATTLLRSKKLVKLADHFWNVSAKFLRTSKDVFDKALDVGENIVEGAWKLGLKAKDKVTCFANSFRHNPKALDKIDDITENITKSKAFKSAIDDVPTNKAMFYVRESGEAIPSTSYKYIDSKSPDLQKILSEGHMPARTSNKPHYGSFNKYHNADDAIDGLQLAKKTDGTPWNDARYRVEFDTLQHIDEIKVPRGKWGDADYLEPLTKDYPKFGQGGATQIIFEGKTKIKKVIDLQTGKTIFPK